MGLINERHVLKCVLNRVGNRMIAQLTGMAYDDFINGLKGFRRWVIDEMQPLVSTDFKLTVEMSIKAVFAGARIEIIPNEQRYRVSGISKFDVARVDLRYLMAMAYSILGHKLKYAGARPRTEAAT